MFKFIKHCFKDMFATVASQHNEQLVNALLQREVSITLAHLKSILQKVNVYDIGANSGAWTKALQRKNNDIGFFLFEANQIHEDKLRETGNYYKIVVLSDKEKCVDFYSTGGTGDSYFKENSCLYHGVQSRKEKTLTLDSVVKSEGIPLPDFIKIDTQGSEIDILKGAEGCMLNARAILLECPIYPYNQGAPVMSEYVSFLLSHGFYPSRCSEIHIIQGVFSQIDIIFLKEDVICQLKGSLNFFK